jgi:hypothetical protein
VMKKVFPWPLPVWLMPVNPPCWMPSWRRTRHSIARCRDNPRYYEDTSCNWPAIPFRFIDTAGLRNLQHAYRIPGADWTNGGWKDLWKPSELIHNFACDWCIQARNVLRKCAIG